VWQLKQQRSADIPLADAQPRAEVLTAVNHVKTLLALPKSHASADIRIALRRLFNPSQRLVSSKGRIMKSLLMTTVALVLGLGAACNSKQVDTVSYEDGVKKALVQAELTDVSVSEDRDKNTVKLGGTVHSDEAKMKATDVAKTSAGNRIVVNEVSVQPVGAESEAKGIASNEDEAIEKNYKASLIASGLGKQHRFRR
jgi:hypothetical protein